MSPHAVLVAVLLFIAVPAHAAKIDTAQIRAAREQAAEAADRLDELAAQLEMASEDYLAAQEELDGTRALIRTTAAELAQAKVEVEQAKGQLTDRARSIYRGDDVSFWSLFTGVTDFRDLVTRVELFMRISQSDAAAVARVKAAKREVERTRASLENRRAEQVALVRKARTERARVDAAVEAQRAYMASLDRKVERLIAEERARLERIAAEEARRKREAAAAAAAAAAANKPGATTPGTDGDKLATPTTSKPAPLSSVAHARALQIARGFMGKVPYLWGGTTPAGFDCSGLTQYCFAQAGIAIPRTSRQQFLIGARIGRDDVDALMAGDLVFFGYDGDEGRIHHVGIYSGNGNYVHAPQTGEMVSESSLLARIERRGDYVGAVRP